MEFEKEWIMWIEYLRCLILNADNFSAKVSITTRNPFRSPDLFWSFELPLEKFVDIYSFFIKACKPFLIFCDENKFLILGILCIATSLSLLIHFKPHKAEKYIEQYRRGKIQRQQAIKEIKERIELEYKRKRLPSVRESKRLEKRLEYLRKKIRAETDLFEDLKEYIRARERGRR